MSLIVLISSTLTNREACLRFMELWKKKHDTGQWLEVEAAEAMSIRSEVSALNASGIIFAADSIMQKDHGDSRSVSGGDIVTGSNGKAGICSEYESSDNSGSKFLMRKHSFVIFVLYYNILVILFIIIP